MSTAAKHTEELLRRPEGATMDEIIAATGGPQYNALRRLRARGWRIHRQKEGRRTRYFAQPPAEQAATVSAKGQVTLPKDVRQRLGLSEGEQVKFVMNQKDDGVQVVPARPGIRALRGILGKPPRSFTLEEMDEAIRQEAVRRALRK